MMLPGDHDAAAIISGPAAKKINDQLNDMSKTIKDMQEHQSNTCDDVYQLKVRVIKNESIFRKPGIRLVGPPDKDGETEDDLLDIAKEVSEMMGLKADDYNKWFSHDPTVNVVEEITRLPLGAIKTKGFDPIYIRFSSNKVKKQFLGGKRNLGKKKFRNTGRFIGVSQDETKESHDEKYAARMKMKQMSGSNCSLYNGKTILPKGGAISVNGIVKHHSKWPLA
jgi:hypothetical protein